MKLYKNTQSDAPRVSSIAADFWSQAAMTGQRDHVKYGHIRSFYEIIARITGACLSVLIELET